MRRTLIGLMAAGTLILGACGGDDDSASGDDAAAAQGGGGGSSEEFCSTITDLMAASTSEGADPQAARERVANLDPPAEIADEWAQYMDLMQASAELDPDDPEAQAQYQQQVDATNEASLVVNDYLTNQCGISDGGSSDSGSDGAEGSNASDGQ
jgi:hypothetical protein